MELNEVLWAEVVLVLVSGFLYFVLAIWRSNSRGGSNYSKRDWNFYLKKIWSVYQINKWKKSEEKCEIRLTNKTEKPINIDDHNTFDSQCFWAADSNGSSIYVAFHRNFGRVSEIAAILTMSDGTVYRLPGQPDTVVFDSSSDTWNAGNLKIVIIEPFKRWRIIFNGMAMKGCKSEWTEDTEKPIHLKMNFIWIAASKPIRKIDDCSTNLLAEAIAIEPWKDPNWLDGLKNYPVCGYDQYGSMSGSIVIDHSDSPNELYLSGIRERRWGLNYAKFMRRSFNITGKTTDGTFYNINIQSHKRRMSQLVFGNVRMPNFETHPIEWTDIDVSEIGEYPSHVRKAFTIKFKAGSRQFTSVIHLNKDKTNLLRGGRPWDWENLIIPYQGSINDYQGCGILRLGYNYTGDCPLRTISEIKQLQYLEIKEIKTNNICLSLKDQETRCSQFVGAKASSLALLMSVESKEYKVPNGFCLTVHALNLQLENNPAIQNAIKDIEENNSNEKKELLQKACERVCNLIMETTLHPPIKETVNIYFQELLNNEKLQSSANSDLYFAVRSSGIGEDSEDLSAAGQNATILGCKTADDIYAAVQKCWASLFTYQSVEYRRQHGQKVYCGMGVVIQTIVEAEAAGVMFTRHPMTGDPSCILITSNYGLGESVVSGKIEPDSIYIEKDLENNIKIKKIDIGSKSHKMTLDKSNIRVDDRLQTSELNEDSNKSSLNDEDCLKLGNIAIDQEILWGSPRDIEWAISNGIVYLVQARPITTLQTWTEFELRHELDTASMSDDDIITFANTGEVLPGSFSPLSFSTITTYLDDSIAEGVGKEPHGYFLQIMSATHHHVGLNVLNTMLVNVTEEISLANKVNDIAIYGHIVTDEKMHSIALHRNHITGKISTTKDLIYFSWLLWNIGKKAKQATKFADSFDINLDKCINSIDIYEKIDAALLSLCCSSRLHSDASGSSFFSQFLFFMILMEGKSDITTENYIDISTVLSSCADVISADVPTSLNELAKLIDQSNKSQSFIEVEPKNGVQWLKDNCPDSHKKLEEFLKKHGHRSIREFDMITDTWGLNPESLIAALQSILKIPAKNDKTKPQGDIIDRLVSPINNITKKLLKLIIPICQKSVACREETKAALIYVIHKYRLAYTKLAKQMMKEWKLPDEKLIFFMTHTELGRYIKHGEPEYINKAVLRRRYFSKWDKMKFSEVCFGFPKPLETVVHKKLNGDNSDVVIKGTPVCSGNITGRACVVHDLSEISQLEDGDILITHSTDIGWSPYFPILGGVVTELGGLISHGAVVAREYGLPCIVGASNATNAFETGDIVTLNATKGLLQKN